jgi:dihydrofolate reductase
MKITYYVAKSLDGFIAREDGDVSWLDDLNINMADTGYDDFYSSIDALAMGRNTYDFVFDFGSWPYGDKPTWICTNRELKPLVGANLSIVKSAIEVVNEAESYGLKHLWLVGGGKLASSFLDKTLLTHLSISEMPIKLMTGIPLFAHHKLENISAERTDIFQKKGFKQMEIILAV